MYPQEGNNINTGMPPVSLVPKPDLSNLDMLQPANPDLAQSDVSTLDAAQLADVNTPVAEQSDLSKLAQEELPPPPFSPVAQPVAQPSMLSVLPQDASQNNLPSGLPQPQDTGQKLSLFMSGKIPFDNSGGNIEKMSRNWSLLKTPVFATVQDNPVMRSTRITNRIGQVANRNGATVTASKLRLI